MNLELIFLESAICLPFTGGIGLLIGISLSKEKNNPTLWWKGLAIGSLVGFAICIFFAILNPCGGFIGC